MNKASDPCDCRPPFGWRGMAAFYEPLAGLLFRPAWQAVVCEATRMAPPRSHVVDLGCGPGTVLRQLAAARPDLRLTGVDPSERILRLAARRAGGRVISWRRGTVAATGLPPGGTSIVLCGFVLHHLTHHAKHEAFREVRRILDPAGVLLLYDFSRPPYARMTPWLWWLQLLKPQIQTHWDGRLLQLARENGAVSTVDSYLKGGVGLHSFRFDGPP